MTFAAIALAATLTATALDGDTIVVGERHIRIANIDALETARARCDAERRLGLAAKARLAELLAAGAITILEGDPVDGRTIDRYGRTLATVSIDGRDVGSILMAEGLARHWEGRRRSWCG